jgi:hypothetical protein
MMVKPYTTEEKLNLCFGMLKYLFYLYMCDRFTGYTNGLKEAVLDDVPNLLDALDPGVTNQIKELARNDTLKGEVMNGNYNEEDCNDA